MSVRWCRAFGVLPATVLSAVAATACEPPGIGDRCTPERSGICVTYFGDSMLCDPWPYRSIAVEPGSMQCQTRTCMVYHFFPAGRVPGEPDWRYCTNPPQPDSPDCQWPIDEAKWPCTGRPIEEFVRKFCKRRPTGEAIVNPVLTPDPLDDAHPWIAGDERAGWYCDFDMTLVDLSQPFCTTKCAGAGRTFECPEGFACKGEVWMGADGLRGSYCIPERLADCDPDRDGDQDCCGL